MSQLPRRSVRRLGLALLLAGCGAGAAEPSSQSAAASTAASSEAPPPRGAPSAALAWEPIDVELPPVLASAAPPRLPEVGRRVGEPAREVYDNVSVLDDLYSGRFTRLMTMTTIAVFPEDGCAGCHDVNDLSLDTPLKAHARRSFAVVRQLNGRWREHLGHTGATCFTCHRGEAEPRFGFYFGSEALAQAEEEPLGAYLAGRAPERTRDVMRHFALSLGTDCASCHGEGGPGDVPAPGSPTALRYQRARSGLRMTAWLAEAYAGGRGEALRDEARGYARVNCLTCHQTEVHPTPELRAYQYYPSLTSLRDAGAPAGE